MSTNGKVPKVTQDSVWGLATAVRHLVKVPPPTAPDLLAALQLAVGPEAVQRTVAEYKVAYRAWLAMVVLEEPYE